MFGPTTLGDYPSALEVAFSINILIREDTKSSAALPPVRFTRVSQTIFNNKLDHGLGIVL